MTTIAALALGINEIRREVTDNKHLTDVIRASLSHSHVGVRYAACQCVRALSRLVSVVRTSLLDSGLGMAVYKVFLKEGEDRRVTFAASSVICNLVNDFSPLRNVCCSKICNVICPNGFIDDARTRFAPTACGFAPF